MPQMRTAFVTLMWLHFICVLRFSWGLLAGDASVARFGNDFLLDRLGCYFLILSNFVAVMALTHSPLFFIRERPVTIADARRERRFYAISALFTIAMSFVYLCDNLGYLWITIEATTLCSAPLVYHFGTKHSLEATWKYFIICSVGIAFALLGTIFVFASSQHGLEHGGSLSSAYLLSTADSLHYPLLRLGFIFCFLGYGTKAGLFPLHSWLPDAHSEAPAPASAMLSGGLLNCALFAIYRVSQILIASHHGELVFHLVAGGGALTTLAAGIFLVRQHGIKRLWAYSSIENVGVMLVAVGLNLPQIFFLQALTHSVAKVALFLLSGNIIQSCGTKELSDISGLLRSSPGWAILLFLAAMAVTGAPPFGTFVSEILLLTACAQQHHWIIMIILTLSLTVAFIAVSYHVGRILTGVPQHWRTGRLGWLSCLVPVSLLVVSLLTGLLALPLNMVGGK